MAARPWFVYIVRCRDGSLYTGVSTDVRARVDAHNDGRGARYTRARRPVTLVHVEPAAGRGAALSREARVKAMRRTAKLALITSAAMLASTLIALQVRADPRPAGPRIDRVRVPAGPYRAGSIHGEDDERPARNARLPAFSIDRTEVTRADFARCIAARRCERPAGFVDPLAGSDDERLPMTGVSWADAGAYCAWARGRLPSEAEWEKAARGTDGREYPWGGDADCARANWGNYDGEGPCATVNPGRPVAVGSHPTGASPCGALDMGGNVWEWVADRYEGDRTRRVVRGGSCCSYFVGPRAANRNAWAPDHRDGDLGFRCAGR
jgi:formylglycine-generating enzyme required for sulfatase activity